MGGGKSSGGGGGSPSSSPYETMLAAIAGDVYKDTEGIRRGFFRDFGSLMGVPDTSDPSQRGLPSSAYSGPANYDPTQLPTYQPLFGLQKQSLESQYQQAKNNIMGATPTGGNLVGALSNLEANRASTMGALPAELSSGIVADMMNKAYGMAANAPTTTMSGLSTAAGTYGNRAAASLAQSAANQQSTYGLFGQLGGAVGEGIGKAVGGK